MMNVLKRKMINGTATPEEILMWSQLATDTDQEELGEELDYYNDKSVDDEREWNDFISYIKSTSLVEGEFNDK